MTVVRVRQLHRDRLELRGHRTAARAARRWLRSTRAVPTMKFAAACTPEISACDLPERARLLLGVAVDAARDAPIPDAECRQSARASSSLSSSTTARSTTTSCRRIPSRSTSSTPARPWVGSAPDCASSSTTIPPPGASPVCRFYRAPAFGDSHFYSANPDECAATAAAHPVDWIYESPNVFYVQLPNTATGACPAGTRPVYRFFRSATTNHRYTMEIVVRNELAETSGLDRRRLWTGALLSGHVRGGAVTARSADAT